MHNAAEFITACKKLKVPEQKVLLASTHILLVLHLPTLILFSLLPDNHCTAKLLMTENCPTVLKAVPLQGLGVVSAHLC